jgi:hypothetical protein
MNAARAQRSGARAGAPGMGAEQKVKEMLDTS